MTILNMYRQSCFQQENEKTDSNGHFRFFGAKHRYNAAKLLTA